MRISNQTIFLSSSALYRNAFDNIRYVLESVVQAIYIDSRYPKTDLGTKIEILKEVEDKIEYHALRLIEELQIDHKDKLKREYKILSQAIHPSHKQIIATLQDVKARLGKIPAKIEIEELQRIFNSMTMM